MRKITLFLLHIILILGCAACGNKVAQEEQNFKDNSIEAQNIKEEQDAYENRAAFDCSVNKMSTVLQNNNNLTLSDDKDLCIFEDKKGRFEIQIGAWGTDITEIYYTIYGEDPTKNKTLSLAFFETVKDIFSVFSENLEQNKIEQKFSEVTKPDQTISFEYSPAIKLFIGKMENDFDFRIYPQ